MTSAFSGRSSSGTDKQAPIPFRARECAIRPGRYRQILRPSGDRCRTAHRKRDTFPGMATTVESLQQGQRVRVAAPGVPDFATVRFVTPADPLASPRCSLPTITAQSTRSEWVQASPAASVLSSRTAQVIPLGSSPACGHGGWRLPRPTPSPALIASTPLRPYAHQTTAVYGAMLPQPLLRFLLADEPGTGKTIMAGLYLREMQRLGLVQRAIVVCPANLASKWVGRLRPLLWWGPPPPH